jgi:indole-3-glycerol phosphate synthase
MIIDDIVKKTKVRIAKEKAETTPDVMKERAHKRGNDRPSFYEALAKKELSYILEVKKASPSKGLIAKDFDYLAIAKEYEAIGADAISVLTEPDFFQGSIDYLRAISEEVNIPLLRKDFVIDDYMIDQAKVSGASAVLLITGILDDDTLKSYLDYAHCLGLDCLVEARDETQVKRAIKAGARIIGVNNRDLRDFSVDIHNSLRYRNLVPDNVLFVSESGIVRREQTKELEDRNVSGVLIGETFMRAADKKKELAILKGAITNEN